MPSCSSRAWRTIVPSLSAPDAAAVHSLEEDDTCLQHQHHQHHHRRRPQNLRRSEGQQEQLSSKLAVSQPAKLANLAAIPTHICISLPVVEESGSDCGSFVSSPRAYVLSPRAPPIPSPRLQAPGVAARGWEASPSGVEASCAAPSPRPFREGGRDVSAAGSEPSVETSEGSDLAHRPESRSRDHVGASAMRVHTTTDRRREMQVRLAALREGWRRQSTGPGQETQGGGGAAVQDPAPQVAAAVPTSFSTLIPIASRLKPGGSAGGAPQLPHARLEGAALNQGSAGTSQRRDSLESAATSPGFIHDDSTSPSLEASRRRSGGAASDCFPLPGSFQLRGDDGFSTDSRSPKRLEEVDEGEGREGEEEGDGAVPQTVQPRWLPGARLQQQQQQVRQLRTDHQQQQQQQPLYGELVASPATAAARWSRVEWETVARALDVASRSDADYASLSDDEKFRARSLLQQLRLPSSTPSSSASSGEASTFAASLPSLVSQASLASQLAAIDGDVASPATAQDPDSDRQEKTSPYPNSSSNGSTQGGAGGKRSVLQGKEGGSWSEERDAVADMRDGGAKGLDEGLGQKYKSDYASDWVNSPATTHSGYLGLPQGTLTIRPYNRGGAGGGGGGNSTNSTSNTSLPIRSPGSVAIGAAAAAAGRMERQQQQQQQHQQHQQHHQQHHQQQILRAPAGAGGALPSQQKIMDAILKAHEIFASDTSSYGGRVSGYLLQQLLSLTHSSAGIIASRHHHPDGAPYLKAHAMTPPSWAPMLGQRTEQPYIRGLPRGVHPLLMRVLDMAHASTSNGDSPAVIDNHPASWGGGSDELLRMRGAASIVASDITSFMGVPLLNGGRLVGLFAVANSEMGYERSMADALVPLSRTAAQIISQILRRLEESEEKQKDRGGHWGKGGSREGGSSADNIMIGNGLIIPKYGQKDGHSGGDRSDGSDREGRPLGTGSAGRGGGGDSGGLGRAGGNMSDGWRSPAQHADMAARDVDDRLKLSDSFAAAQTSEDGGVGEDMMSDWDSGKMSQLIRHPTELSMVSEMDCQLIAEEDGTVTIVF